MSMQIFLTQKGPGRPQMVMLKKNQNLLFCQKISGSGYSSGEVYVTGHLELAGAGSVGLEVRSQSALSQQGSLRDGGLQ